MVTYNAEEEWTKHYLSNNIMYPAENVVRIFKGKYPNLSVSDNSFSGKRICDLGMGDGRNIVFFNQLGFELFGMEISEEIVNKAKTNLKKFNIESTLKVGSNFKIPFEDNFFDYLLSWDACYYMGKNQNFPLHVFELARILKKDGFLIMSMPKKNHIYFENCEKLDNGLVVIKNDPLNVRNGEVLRMFDDEQDIEQSFSKYFTNFKFSSEDNDLFGLKSHWHRVVCQKK